MAFNLYGGISEQNYCNCHPGEQWGLGYWANIARFSPQKYEWVSVWDGLWTVQTGLDEVRRGVFESVYGHSFGQEPNPIDGELVDVIYLGNEEYYQYLADFFQDGADCSGLLFPQWP